jgi:hypothetical protein
MYFLRQKTVVTLQDEDIPRGVPLPTVSVYWLPQSHGSAITQIIFSSKGDTMLSLSKNGCLQGRSWSTEIKLNGKLPTTAEASREPRDVKPRQLAITSSDMYLLVANRKGVSLYDPANSASFMQKKRTAKGDPMILPASPNGAENMLASLSLHPSDNNCPVYGFKVRYNSATSALHWLTYYCRVSITERKDFCLHKEAPYQIF